MNLTTEQLNKLQDRVDQMYPEDSQDEPDETLFDAQVRWHPVDLMDENPGRFASIEEASEWLSDNASYIQEAMVEAGRDAIKAII